MTDTDIVARLRGVSGNYNYNTEPKDTLREAADEIELLREEVEMLRAHRDSLMAIVARQAAQKLETEQ